MFFQKTNEFRSKLFDEKGFYKQFTKDLKDCKQEVIIESPYITSSRMEQLYPVLTDLLTRKVQVYIITRVPSEQDEIIRYQATNEILKCADLGINITLLKGSFHRKLIVLDRAILWEGSLNALSYTNSREIMRRIEGKEWANQMINFLRLKQYLKR